VSPLFLFPERAFVAVPFVPTLEGQYILKNAVLVSAGLVLGGTVRGGRVVADPALVERLEEQVAAEGGAPPPPAPDSERPSGSARRR
jgi:hypothetical protein